MGPDTIAIIVTMLGVGVALGALILTVTHRSEARLNKRIDAIENDISVSETRTRAEITASEARTSAEIKASEARTSAEIKASEARTSAEIKASEARTSAKFEEVREQFVEVNEQFRQTQARTEAGFADVNEQLRTTNDRMAAIERQQARLGGLLDGLREALFQRVQQ